MRFLQASAASTLLLVPLLCQAVQSNAKIAREPEQNSYLNELMELSYHQGELVDTIICYFKEVPACVYEPIRESKAKSRPLDKHYAHFFLPFTALSKEFPKQVLQQIQAAGKENYTISINEVTVPVKGLRIAVSYNPQKIGWEYGPSDALNPRKGLVFKIYNKELLRTIKEKSTPLRWYAQGKHQPRIVIDVAPNTGYHFKRDNLPVLGAQIASQLRNQGCEVLFTRVTYNTVAPSIRTSYANLYAHADVFLSLAASSNTPPVAFIVSPALFKVRQGILTSEERKSLAELTKWVHIQSSLLETAVDDKLKMLVKAQEVPLFPKHVETQYNEVLAGVEMPALCVQLGTLGTQKGASSFLDIADAIASGITFYLSEKKFLKSLYKPTGSGKLKITLNNK